MKYKGKKNAIQAIIAALSLSTITSIPVQIQGYKNSETEITHQIDLTDERLTDIKKDIQSELLSEEANLDFRFSDYIRGISIDGKIINIELINGAVITGSPNTINLSNLLELDYLHIVDTEYIKSQLNNIHIKQSRRNPIININNIEVKKELKYIPYIANFFPYENAIFFEGEINSKSTEELKSQRTAALNNIRFKDCENVWFYGITLTDEIYNQLNSGSIKRLYLTHCKDEDGIIDIRSDSIKTLIIEELATDGNFLNRIMGLNLSECKNLENLQFGSFTCVENLDGLQGLQSLNTLSFGRPSLDTLNLLLDNFYTREQHICYYNNCYPETCSTNFISDLSAINNTSLEVLDISELQNVTSRVLFNTVVTLPNLKEIIGNDSNNASMYSDDLIRYCERNNIKHPFTEKSKKIKDRLTEIVSEIITDEMKTDEKIKTLLKYVIVNMYADTDLADSAKNNGNIKDEYENSLYNAIFQGTGVCDGYERFFHALLMESNVLSYRIGIPGHVYEVIEKNRDFQKIDPTFLDGDFYYCENMEDISNEELEKSPYYMENVFQTLDSSLAYAIPKGWNEQFITLKKEDELRDKKENFMLFLKYQLGIFTFLTGIIAALYKLLKSYYKKNTNKNDIIKSIDKFLDSFDIKSLTDFFHNSDNFPSVNDISKIDFIEENDKEGRSNE